MEHSDYRRQLAELEHQEAKLWREFVEARNDDLRDRANAIHARHRRVVERIMKVHEEKMAEFIHEDERLGA